VDATSKRSREASFDGADGVVRNGTLFKDAFRNTSAFPTTPSAPLRWLRIFLLMAQPPLLYQAELSKLAFEVDRKGLNLNVGSAKRPSFAIK